MLFSQDWLKNNLASLSFLIFNVVMGIKKFFVFLISIIIISVVICIINPKMHKQFSFNVIEYIIKFGQNGQIETTKTITTVEAE